MQEFPGGDEFVIRQSSFVKSSFNNRHSTIVIRKSSFINRHSSIVIRK
jgi:hypothetical protein